MSTSPCWLTTPGWASADLDCSGLVPVGCDRVFLAVSSAWFVNIYGALPVSEHSHSSVHPFRKAQGPALPPGRAGPPSVGSFLMPWSGCFPHLRSGWRCDKSCKEPKAPMSQYDIKNNQAMCRETMMLPVWNNKPVSHTNNTKWILTSFTWLRDGLPIISSFSVNLRVCFKVMTHVKHDIYNHKFYWFLYFFLFNVCIES